LFGDFDKPHKPNPTDPLAHKIRQASKININGTPAYHQLESLVAASKKDGFRLSMNPRLP
jgi:hypothetical protein